MRIIGCDLHARQQTVAVLDTDSGELVEKTLQHEGDSVREFYSTLERKQESEGGCGTTSYEPLRFSQCFETNWPTFR
jgi:hypothetical protein